MLLKINYMLMKNEWKMKSQTSRESIKSKVNFSLSYLKRIAKKNEKKC